MILFQGKKWRIFIGVLIGVLLLVLVLELGFNMWMKVIIRRGFLRDPAPDSQVTVDLGWLSIKDIIGARVNRIQINSRDCKLGELRYQSLDIESERITFVLPVLFKEKRFQIDRIQRTRVKAAITDTAFEEYLNSAYSAFNPRLKIFASGIQLSGKASVFGNTLPVILEGRLGIAGPKQLRFFPDRLMVAGRPVAPSFLQFISREIPLEFTIIKEWPLMITGVRLEKGVLFLSLKELES